jgi:GNAT superfamily N-acetyltransferase
VAGVWSESAAAAFLPLLPEGHALPELDPRRFAEIVADPAVRLLVAEGAEGLLGYTIFGASRDRDLPADVGEVRTFFVRPAAWRRGVGSALMSGALSVLPELGYTAASVWSFADNERANAFYERHGFERDGAERREEAWAGILEVRLRRSLST